MKIKLDENIPFNLSTDLAALGHDVDTVVQEGLKGHADPSVWKMSCSAGRFLITQDFDFSDVRAFAPGNHPGILLVRMRDPGRTAVRNRLLQVFTTENVGAWAGCFVVVSDRKIRVRSASDSQA
jgi:predicted nuclease of predicted toxin-antitoxin system